MEWTEDAEFGELLFKKVVHKMATVARATEAAGFLLNHRGLGTTRCVHHLRGDNSGKIERDAAIKAFGELVETCVHNNKNGAIEVAGATSDQGPQFCLITLIRDGNQPRAAVAVIARCPDLEEARERLALIAFH